MQLALETRLGLRVLGGEDEINVPIALSAFRDKRVLGLDTDDNEQTLEPWEWD